MSDPHTLRGNGPTVWPGHRGDGDLGYQLAGASGLLDVEEAKRQAHDRVIAHTGHRRAGPVHWLIWPRDEGLRTLAETGVPVPEDLADFLAQHPHGWLVMALAATDRIRPRARAKRKPGKATRKASR